MTRFSLAAAFALGIASGMPAAAQTPPRNNYADEASWLCRPGRQDACAADLSTTVVAADATTNVERWAPDPSAPLDCFYVYPTVSLDPGGNSDMNAGTEERRVVLAQLARFASVCRLYAPLYRQATLTALRANAAVPSSVPVDRVLAYNDVADAWRHYLERDNHGRGVALIGHSQGAGVLTQLIRNEIDGTPIQSRIVSALLLGTNVAVPRGKDVGGAFANIPLCRSAQQTGCVISYVTFRATMPPRQETRFGRVLVEGQEAACTNPAALGGGKGELHAYFTASGGSIVSPGLTPPVWVKGGRAVTTPFVSVPGLLTGQCVSNGRESYLEVTVNANVSDPRADDIPGDVITNGQPNPSWGLHLVDVHIAMGNLLDIVRRQGQAYVAKAKTTP